jgi:uncharacterized protein
MTRLSHEPIARPPAARLALAAIAIAATLGPGPIARAADKAPSGLITVPDDGNSPVIDQAHVLDPASTEKLIVLLHSLKRETGAQVKVLTVPSLGSEDVFAFTERHFELWKLGQKGKDNGVLVVLAPKEHKIRIHVGYGLEGVLPDIWCGSIERQAAKLYFVRGQYAQGLTQLVQAIAQRIATDAKAPLAGLSKEPLPLPKEPGGDGTIVFVVLFLIMVIGIVILGQIQMRQQRRWGSGKSGFGRNYFPYMPGGPFGGGSSSGGWTFGGGSSGGWSSGGSDFGGGGSTGGGGASSSW